MNCRTIYDLMASHGCVEDMVFFAGLMKGTPYFIANCDNSCNNHWQQCECIKININITHLSVNVSS